VKQIISFFLLLALLVNLMGYFVIFQCSRMILRCEMAEMIRTGTCEKKYETIRIANTGRGKNAELQDENEISFNGILYDIVKTTRNHEGVTYTCVRDDKEQNLLSKFSLLLRQTEAFGESHKARPILALFCQLILQATIQKATTQRPFTALAFNYPVLTCPISPVYLPVFSPPPEM